VTGNYFDEPVTASYDLDEAEMFTAAAVGPAVAVLAGLAGDSGALEFGIGTGRIALPLSQRGIRVHGIDLSPAMAARLAAKPGADRVGVTIGDFATTRVDGTFRLAYLVFDTIMNLTTQDAQADCFLNAASHLEPGGWFVIETMVPDLQRLPPGERFRPSAVTADHLSFDEYDVLNQGLVSHHYTRRQGALEAESVPFRYVWPSELDLMARLAGLTLRHRWGNWHREPFTAASTSHVSAWQLAG
jgi:hypothetical protein